MNETTGDGDSLLTNAEDWRRWELPVLTLRDL